MFQLLQLLWFAWPRTSHVFVLTVRNFDSLILRNWVLLEKPIIPQLVRNSSHFIERENSLPCLQDSATALNLCQLNSVYTVSPCFFKTHLIEVPDILFGLPSGSFFYFFPPKRCIYFSCLPCVPHVAPVSPFWVWSLEYCLERSFNVFLKRQEKRSVERESFPANFVLSCPFYAFFSSKRSSANAMWLLSLFRPRLGRYLTSELPVLQKWAARRTDSLGLTAQQNVCRLSCTRISVSSSGFSHVYVMSWNLPVAAYVYRNILFACLLQVSLLQNVP